MGDKPTNKSEKTAQGNGAQKARKSPQVLAWLGNTADQLMGKATEFKNQTIGGIVGIALLLLVVLAVLAYLKVDDTFLSLARHTIYLCVIAMVVIHLSDNKKAGSGWPMYIPDGEGKRTSILKGTTCILSKDEKYRVPLYTFYGYRFEKFNNRTLESLTTTDSKNNTKITYQDFADEENCIQNMWASAHDKSYIQAEVKDDKNELGNKVLAVKFKYDSHGPNVNIRSCCYQPFRLPDNIHKLVIRAKANPNKNSKKELALGVRIVNGYFQHWSHSHEPLKYKPLELGPEFEEMSIPLTKERWTFFQSDGNMYYEDIHGKTATFEGKDTFKYILGVVLEFGSKRKGLVDGEGTVEISEIYFSS